MTGGFRIQTTGAEFDTLFPNWWDNVGLLGRWVDDDRVDGLELIHYYFVDAAGNVGEEEYNRRTTCSKFYTLSGECAEMTKYTYRKAA